MKNKIQACPNLEDIEKASEILYQQFLHLYQLLYFNKMTSPEGNPLKIEKYEYYWLKVYNPLNEKELWFITNVAQDSNKKLLEKSKMILEGVDRKKIDRRACCCYAEIVPCVCEIFFQCPLHGETHIGTHD